MQGVHIDIANLITLFGHRDCSGAVISYDHGHQWVLSHHTLLHQEILEDVRVAAEFVIWLQFCDVALSVLHLNIFSYFVICVVVRFIEIFESTRGVLSFYF